MRRAAANGESNAVDRFRARACRRSVGPLHAKRQKAALQARAILGGLRAALRGGCCAPRRRASPLARGALAPRERAARRRHARVHAAAAAARRAVAAAVRRDAQPQRLRVALSRWPCSCAAASSSSCSCARTRARSPPPRARRRRRRNSPALTRPPPTWTTSERASLCQHRTL